MANFIKAAIRHPGALTAQAKRAGQSPMAFATAHKHSSGTTGKRARLALTLRGMAKKNAHPKAAHRRVGT